MARTNALESFRARAYEEPLYSVFGLRAVGYRLWEGLPKGPKGLEPMYMSLPRGWGPPTVYIHCTGSPAPVPQCIYTVPVQCTTVLVLY